MNIKNIDELDLKGKKVLTRVDFNVPLDEDKNITNDIRIVRALPTIRKILDDGGIPVIMSHLGRPKGKKNPDFSLAPVAEKLGELLNKKIKFLDDCIGEIVKSMITEAIPGDVILLENVRFYAEETDNDENFAKELASLGDVYVNDAFGAAHRAHASTVGMAKYFEKKAVGYLMQKELDFLYKVLESPVKPVAAVIGGAKISGKIDLINNLLKNVDFLLIGGGMCGTFFKAMGKEIGDSLVEDDKVELAKSIIESEGYKSGKLLLPVDAVIADRFDNNAEKKTVSINDVPHGWQILDIGPETVKKFGEILLNAKTVFWNGPLGVFEMENFAEGTRKIAELIAKTTEKGAVSVIGGGDSASAIAKFRLADKISHISTGGGASLELMEGKMLPGVAAIIG